METYQPIFDAVRSRITGGDIGQVVREAIRELNLGHYVECAATLIGYECTKAAEAHAAPSAVFRPKLGVDGNQWYALYGENLQDGVAGFGDSPQAAMCDFDARWVERITSAVQASD